ncbi:DUF3177 domain-containing protein [filamentous cyanobacterium CCP3]|nr:DUF3177 domain-containing protein [filamentous cyanobacterium CCP3]
MLEPSLLRALVWTDYRLAVLFTVFLPLALLVWAFVQKNEAIQHLLTIYWKVASLLMITVYLMIGGFSISFVAGLMARVLIPLSLWFWVDLNEEIREQPGSVLKLLFSAWRWAITLYNIIGGAILLGFVPCAFSAARFGAADCQVWLEPPLLYKEYFHAGYTNGFLGFFGILGLVIYVASLAWFVFVRLGKQGRQAIN